MPFEVIETAEGPTNVLKLNSDAPATFKSPREAVAHMRKARSAASAEGAPPPAAPSQTPPAESAAQPQPTAAGEQSAAQSQESAPPAREEERAPPAQAEATPQTPTEAQPEAELPPIEPPRSWTKEAKDRFASLPRDTQEYLLQRETERDRAVSRSQQEAAKWRQDAEAKFQQADQIRARYEQALPQMVQAMQTQMMGEFADIQNWQDVENLARTDFPRFQLWQLAKQKMEAAARQMEEVTARQQAEIADKWKNYHTAEDAKFSQQSPEMADPVKARVFRDNVRSTLSDLGFNDDEVRDAWNGKVGVALRDHRVQLLIRKATLYDQMMKNAGKIAEKKAPVPPVVRPGVARSAGADSAQEIRDIQKAMETASGVKALRLAQQLTQLQRKAGQL